MSTLAGLVGCLGALGALGSLERLARDAARRAVPVRVHVNGTRGKSTVTRMIWAALREAGIPAVAKTTGTAPRVLLPDGSERPVRRRAPASIREQLWLLRLARRTGARALVAECMAVDPALQWVSEHDMIQATLGVITNVRTDHLESMGSSLDQIAASLANTIPRRGVLELGEARFAELFRRRAASVGTRVVVAVAADDPDWPALPEATHGEGVRENLSTALTACRELGLAPPTAWRGIRGAPPDPGAVRRGALVVSGRTIEWLDATAANDPESFDSLAGVVPAPALVVYNHRADRPRRLEVFAGLSATFRAALRVILTGDGPAWASRRRLAAWCPGLAIEVVPRRRLAAAVAADLSRLDPAPGRLAFAGNTRGLVVSELLEEVRAAVGGAAAERRGGRHR